MRIRDWSSDVGSSDLWTSMLNLVGPALKRRGYNYIRLDGSMSQPEREAAINSFNTDPNIRLFLISVKAGGLGPNLPSASRVRSEERRVGTGVSVRVDLGGRRIIKKKKNNTIKR